MFNLLTGLWTPFVCLAILWLLFLVRYLSTKCCKSCGLRNGAVSPAPVSSPESSALENAPTQSFSKVSTFASLPDAKFSIRDCCESRFKFQYIYQTVITDPHLVQKHVRATIALLLFSYNSIVNTIFKFVDCYEIAPSESYVSTAPAISCQSDEYKRMFPLIVVLLVVIVGLSPLIIIAFLYRIRHRLDDSVIRLKFGVLYQYYRPSIFFWVCYLVFFVRFVLFVLISHFFVSLLKLQEAIIIARRVVLICLTVFLRNSSNGFSLITVTNLLFLLSQLYLLPFEDSGDNQRENLTLAVLTLVTSLLTQAPRPLPLSYAIPLSLLVLFTGFGLVFSIVASKLCKRKTNRTLTASGLESKKGNVASVMEVEMPSLHNSNNMKTNPFDLNSSFLNPSSVPSSSDPMLHLPTSSPTPEPQSVDHIVPLVSTEDQRAPEQPRPSSRHSSLPQSSEPLPLSPLQRSLLPPLRTDPVVSVSSVPIPPPDSSPLPPSSSSS
jgi:hypothetical protein